MLYNDQEMHYSDLVNLKKLLKAIIITDRNSIEDENKVRGPKKKSLKYDMQMLGVIPYYYKYVSEYKTNKCFRNKKLLRKKLTQLSNL